MWTPYRNVNAFDNVSDSTSLLSSKKSEDSVVNVVSPPCANGPSATPAAPEANPTHDDLAIPTIPTNANPAPPASPDAPLPGAGTKSQDLNFPLTSQATALYHSALTYRMQLRRQDLTQVEKTIDIATMQLKRILIVHRPEALALMEHMPLEDLLRQWRMRDPVHCVVQEWFLGLIELKRKLMRKHESNEAVLRGLETDMLTNLQAQILNLECNNQPSKGMMKNAAAYRLYTPMGDLPAHPSSYLRTQV